MLLYFGLQVLSSQLIKCGRVKASEIHVKTNKILSYRLNNLIVVRSRT